MPGGGWEGTILPQTPQPWQLHDLHKPSGSSSLGTWPPEGLLPVRPTLLFTTCISHLPKVHITWDPLTSEPDLPASCLCQHCPPV